MNIEIGQLINNRYRVEKNLGRGGMAEVYKVYDQKRATYLAMKVLREDLAEDVVFVRRFKREAEALARLQHPNIVRFYEFEQVGATAMILMEFIEGSTLRSEIARGQKPLSLERIQEILIPVCAALHYAHNLKMVHCDVKPANIMVKKNGDILLTDFGIARLAEGATTATLVGSGTPAYMAPEQILGKDPVPQTDIYALGIVLYEMLTGGDRPFTGDQAQITGTTGEKVRWEHLKSNPPSPRKYNQGIPLEVEAVVMKCLEKDPRKRYLNADSFLNSLIKREKSELNPPEREGVPIGKAKSGGDKGEKLVVRSDQKRLSKGAPKPVQPVPQAVKAVPVSTKKTARKDTEKAVKEKVSEALKLAQSGKPNEGLSMVIDLLNSMPDAPDILEAAGMIVGIEQNNIHPTILADPILDPVFTQCCKCGVSWGINPLYDMGFNIQVINAAGGACPKSKKVFCRNCATRRNSSLFCPENGHQNQPLVLIDKPTGRNSHLTFQPRSRKEKLARVAIFMDKPPINSRGESMLLLRTLCPEALEDQADISFYITDKLNDPAYFLTYLSEVGANNGWPDYSNKNKYEISYKSFTDSDENHGALLFVYELEAGASKRKTYTAESQKAIIPAKVSSEKKSSKGRDISRSNSKNIGWLFGLFSVIIIMSVLALFYFLMNRSSIQEMTQNNKERISEINASQMIELSRFGKGRAIVTSLSPAGDMMAVGTSLGVYFIKIDGSSDDLFFDTESEILDISYAADGSLIAGLNDEGTIFLWRSDGSQWKRLEGGGFSGNVAFSPDGTRLASIALGTTVEILDISDTHFDVILTLDTQGESVRSAEFSADGKMLAAGVGNTIKLWSAVDGALINTYPLNSEEITSIIFSPDGNTLASSSSNNYIDNFISVWDVHTGNLILRDEGGYYNCQNCMSFSHNGDYLASGTNEGIKIWVVKDGFLVLIKVYPSQESLSIDFSRDDQQLVFLANNTTISMLNINNDEKTLVTDQFSDLNFDAAISDDNSMLAIGVGDEIQLRELHGYDLLQIMTGHVDWVRDLEFSPDSEILASGSQDATIKLWQVNDGSLIRKLDGHDRLIWSIDFSPDGKLLASASDDRSVKLWSVNDGTELSSTTSNNNKEVRCVQFSPDGSILAGGFADEIVLWRVSDMSQIKSFADHHGVIDYITFSPSGDLLASAAGDVINIWRVSDGRLIWSINSDGGSVFGLAFSPDEKLIASAGNDDLIKLWSVKEGVLIRSLQGHTSVVYSVTFSSDGKSLVSSSADGTVIIWGLPNRDKE